MHLSLNLTNLIANNWIKLLLLTSEQNLCEMALVKMLLATARFVITTIQRKFVYFFVFFFPEVPHSIHPAVVAMDTAVTNQCIHNSNGGPRNRRLNIYTCILLNKSSFCWPICKCDGSSERAIIGNEFWVKVFVVTLECKTRVGVKTVKMRFERFAGF